MSDRNQHDRGALVALALILAAIVLVAFITTFREPFREAVAAPDAHGVQQEKPQPATPVESSPNFLLLGDGAAQWVMAIFTIVATGISLYAVRVVRDTFRETKRTADLALEANNTAREIGEAQTRAYLSVEFGEFIIGRRHIEVRFRIANFGSSPAPSCEVLAQLHAPRISNGRVEAASDYSEPSRVNVLAIQNGQPVWSNYVGFFDPLPQVAHSEVYKANFLVAVDAQLRWYDVFGRRQLAEFTLREKEPGLRTFNNDSPKSRIGELSVYAVKPNDAE